MSNQRTQYKHMDQQQLILRLHDPEISYLELMAMSSVKRKIYKQQCKRKGIAIPTPNEKI